MLSVHSKSVLYNHGVKVACVAYLVTARADFKQSANLSSACVLSEYTDRYNTCTCTIPALSKTPLHRSIQRLSLRELFIMHSRVGLVYSHSFVLASSVDYHHWNHSKHQKTTYQLLVVVSLLYSHCAWLRRPSLLVGLASFDITELQGDAHTTSLSHSVRTSAAPQNQKQIAHCIPRQRTLVKWNLSVDAVHTASSASGIKERITILSIRCFAWNCLLSVWNRRHHDSPRVVQKTVDTRVARETPTVSSSRTGTIRTFLDSTPDGILSSPTSVTIVFGLRGFGALGPIFPLVITSRPFEPCLKV